MYENDELLYTQEDMDEWMRTCENLQEHIKEQEEQIKYLKDLCDKERLKATELQQQIRGEKTVFDMYRAKTIQKGIADPEATKIIRKQVCDEIKKELSRGYPHFDWEDMKDSYLYDISGKELYDVIDKIEKGERDD